MVQSSGGLPVLSPKNPSLLWRTAAGRFQVSAEQFGVPRQHLSRADKRFAFEGSGFELRGEVVAFQDLRSGPKVETRN